MYLTDELKQYLGYRYVYIIYSVHVNFINKDFPSKAYDVILCMYICLGILHF